MTALALTMQDAGWDVSGSDTDENFITDAVLNQRHIRVQQFADPIPPVDQIIYSAAYATPSPNALSLAQALADFVADRQVIAVAGVGGKTTTSAMLAALFQAAGRDAGYYVGTGSISGLSAPGHAGSDPVYIVESDEYAVSKTDRRPKFALLPPHTNIVHDHPDIYPDAAATLATFRELIARIPSEGTWVACDTDPLTQQILRGDSPKCHVVTYSRSHSLFDKLSLQVFGDQNRLDALAAVLGAEAAGIPIGLALQSIHAYAGAGLRQELHGEVAGRILYDDYGHHPDEISITVKSFKQHFPNRRLLLVFESHTYTRTEALLAQFANALRLADQTFIMPIFESAREKGQPHTVTTASFAEKVSPITTPLTWDNAAQTVWQASQPGDIILTMGAGFVYKLHTQFKEIGELENF